MSQMKNDGGAVMTQVLKQFPIILTKDAEFFAEMVRNQIKPGQVILLPEDAVLIEYSDKLEHTT